jgi:hypothetical protein
LQTVLHVYALCVSVQLKLIFNTSLL